MNPTCSPHFCKERFRFRRLQQLLSFAVIVEIERKSFFSLEKQARIVSSRTVGFNMSSTADRVSLFSVEGIVAVITGGGSGLGANMALALDASIFSFPRIYCYYHIITSMYI